MRRRLPFGKIETIFAIEDQWDIGIVISVIMASFKDKNFGEKQHQFFLCIVV